MDLKKSPSETAEKIAVINAINAMRANSSAKNI